jgi:aspartate 1-decarboxylase
VQAWLGQVLTKSGTLRNLYVKQEQLNSAPFGGTINVWVNPKTGTSPIQTSIACTLAPNGNLYTCNNTAATYSVQTGDQVIVIVTPPGGNTVSPMAATIDVQ